MPMIRVAKGVYALYSGKKRKTVPGQIDILGYYIAYRNSEGKSIKERTDATTKEEASLMLKQAIVNRDRGKEMDAGASMLKGKMNISQIADLYFATRPDQFKKSYQTYIEPMVGKLKRVKPMVIPLLQQQMAHLAPKTINNYTDLLQAILNFGIDNDYLHADSYRMHKYKKLDVDNWSERYFDPQEVQELFTKALWSNARLMGKEDKRPYTITYSKYRTQFFLKMLYYTGQRPMSILKLQRKHITDAGIHIAPIKKQKAHRAAISSSLAGDLNEWIEGLEPNDFLFHPQSEPTTAISNFTMLEQAKPLFGSYNKGLSFKDDRKQWTSFYTLRHSHATNMTANTGSLHQAQISLSHSSSKMTERYAKALPALTQDAVDNL